MADTALHTRYRPIKLSQVIGQDAVLTSIKRVLKKKHTHAFAFIGPSGVGKTTMARIVAQEVGCLPENIVEVDAATVTGIDAMRELTAGAHYRSLGSSPFKAFILDEFHRLSPAAVTSLLKELEEPPEHVYWFLCTTESAKVTKVVRSRCACYNLRPIETPDILTVLETIVEKEGIEIGEDVLELCARQAEGSVRQAITHLTVCQGVTDRREAKRLIEAAFEGRTVIDLCRYVLWPQPRTWAGVVKHLEPLRAETAESLRIVMVNYFNAILLPKDPTKETKDKTAFRVLEVLDYFIEPFPQQNGFAALTLAVARSVFGHRK